MEAEKRKRILKFIKKKSIVCTNRTNFKMSNNKDNIFPLSQISHFKNIENPLE